MRRLLAAIAALMFATTVHAEVTGGVIESIDPENQSIKLDDGQTYRLNNEIDFSTLKKGIEVYIAYDTVNGENIVTDMDIDE